MASFLKVNHLVVDSGGFIRNADLVNLGDRIYTLGGVVAEIKDKTTRQRLQVLPYELVMKEPTAAAIKFVSDFAKKTGDYKSLSATDIRLIALTYQLHKEHGATECLRDVPHKMVEGEKSQSGKDEAGFPGFFMPKESTNLDSVVDTRTNDSEQEPHDTAGDLPLTSDPAGEESHLANGGSQVGSDDQTESSDTSNSTPADESLESIATRVKSCILDSARVLDSDIAQEEENDSDDDDGWVTSDNIASVKQALGIKSEGTKEHCDVGCLTTDFSMQNVLIQIGLRVVSVDGMIVEKAKSFVLRCRSCFKITSQTERRFCPHCGNSSLNRLTVTVEDDGTLKYWFSKRWRPNLRGLKYSLPTPQGGKHSSNPILVEDQPVPQQRISRSARQKTDVWNPDYDYIAQTNPFAVNDVTSRAARLGISGAEARWDKRNPNVNHGSKGNKKKRR